MLLFFFFGWKWNAMRVSCPQHVGLVWDACLLFLIFIWGGFQLSGFFKLLEIFCACSFDCIILIGSFLKGFLFFNVVTCSCGVWDCGSCWESCEYQVLFQIFWQFGCVVWITKYYRLGTFLVIGSGGYFEWWTGLEKWHAGQAS